MNRATRTRQAIRDSEGRAGIVAGVITLTFLALRFGVLDARYPPESLLLEAVVLVFVAFAVSAVFAEAFYHPPERHVAAKLVILHAGTVALAVFVLGVCYGLVTGFAGPPQSVVMAAVQLFVAVFFAGVGALVAFGVGALVALAATAGTAMAGRVHQP